MTFRIHARTAGGGGGTPAPPTSQLRKQNFILTPWGGCEIGDYKAFEGRNHSLGLIISLRLRGKVENRGGTGWGSDLQIFALKC